MPEEGEGVQIFRNAVKYFEWGVRKWEKKY
jgi:hypothetical protein